MTKCTRESPKGKVFIMAMVSMIFLGTFVYQAGAVSMGPYVDISSGSGTVEWDISGYEFDVDTNSVAVGFALDTAVTNQSFFNYRLNIGFEGQELEDEVNDNLDLNRITFENIFGFALLQQPDLRWWGASLIRFGYCRGDTNTRCDGIYEMSIMRDEKQGEIFFE